MHTPSQVSETHAYLKRQIRRFERHIQQHTNVCLMSPCPTCLSLRYGHAFWQGRLHTLYGEDPAHADSKA